MDAYPKLQLLYPPPMTLHRTGALMGRRIDDMVVASPEEEDDAPVVLPMDHEDDDSREGSVATC